MTESPARFRKKPLEAEAIQYTGENPSDVAAFIGGGFTLGGLSGALRVHRDVSGELYLYVWDWAVRSGDHVQIIDADTFTATYEAAPQPLELSEVERVAVEHTEHMSTCHEPACVDCMRELRAVRRTIKAVEPVIARGKATELVARIAAAVESYEPEAHPVVCPPSVAYAFAKEKAVEIVRGFAPVEPEAVTQE